MLTQVSDDVSIPFGEIVALNNASDNMKDSSLNVCPSRFHKSLRGQTF